MRDDKARGRQTRTCEDCGAAMNIITTSARAGASQPSETFFKCVRCGRIASFAD